MMIRALRSLLAGAVVASAGLVVTATSAGASASKVTFAYDFPGPDFELIPVVVAQQEGFFSDNGLSVSTVFPPNTSTTSRMLATGAADLGFITTTDMAVAVNAKVPVVSVANYSMANNWGLFTKPGTSLSLKNLKGKTVFSYGDTWTDAMLPFVLKKAGLKSSDIKIVSGTNDIPLLLAGKTDISTSTTNYEIPGIVDASGKKPGRLVGSSALGVPNVPIWVYATTSSYGSKHPNNVVKFLKAVKAATKWAIAHPTKAVNDFEKAYPRTVTRHHYNVTGWSLTIPYLTNAKHQFFVQNDAQWTTLATALHDVGQISSVPAPKKYYANRYLALLNQP
jgi:ABC-type nitrate/sulfonate/bicarbonate transport system substrate-binding protein